MTVRKKWSGSASRPRAIPVVIPEHSVRARDCGREVSGGVNPVGYGPDPVSCNMLVIFAG
jgi:hypothetical protein